jgi:hypothetical protein
MEVMHQHQHQHQHQHAPLPVEQLSGIPQPLVALLEILLAKDPVRRFQTPAELLKVMPTVRDAINAGRAMMKTIRVFVSSTGDVQKERHVAERVMRSIATEFNLPVSDSRVSMCTSPQACTKDVCMCWWPGTPRSRSRRI